MAILKKAPDKDFTILNLADTQISLENFETKNKDFNLMCATVRKLIETVKPDLITNTGDLSLSGSIPVYEFYAEFMDSLEIPWAFVWGNHDSQGGPNETKRAANVFKGHKFCLFEEGDETLGSGNYVIEIQENDIPVEALIMMDSHDRVPYADNSTWAKLLPEQLDWYGDIIKDLKARGCKDSTIFTHIPPYGYFEAYNAATNKDHLDLWESYGSSVWNEGYKDSFGVKWEGICCYPEDDGVLDEVVRLGHTKNIVVGHDHVNNFSIKYRGVRLTYSLKTGSGCYWNEELSGGTVMKVNKSGVCDLYHVYTNPKKLCE